MRYKIIKEESVVEGKPEVWFVAVPRNWFYRILRNIFTEYLYFQTIEEARRCVKLKAELKWNLVKKTGVD